MCTLIFGRDVLGPGTIVLGANRDEDPGRATDPPRTLSRSPDVVGGRDGVAGGTWLAIRDGWSVIAVLNRRPLARPTRPIAGAVPNADTVAPRSRGLLALDVARVEPGVGPEEFPRAALLETQRLVREHGYAPFTLVCLSPSSAWVMSRDAGEPARVSEPGAGWHVVTHAAIDDRDEPRTAWLLEALAGFAPATPLAAEARLLDLLSQHGAEPSGDAGDAFDPDPDRSAAASSLAGDDAFDRRGATRQTPAVCIHRGRMVTVSTSLFARTPTLARYLHLEGRPCTATPQDLTALLGAPAPPGDRDRTRR